MFLVGRVGGGGIVLYSLHITPPSIISTPPPPYYLHKLCINYCLIVSELLLDARSSLQKWKGKVNRKYIDDCYDGREERKKAKQDKDETGVDIGLLKKNHNAKQ